MAQAAFYTLFGLALAHFSNRPSYTHIDPGQAVLTLSFDHAGARAAECRPLDCPRERVPLLVELELDGERLYRGWAMPLGLASDGPASVYERFLVLPGSHEIIARLRDSRRPQGFDYEDLAQVELAARQNFVIDFRADTGFTFR
jgi:hypothetical protein